MANSAIFKLITLKINRILLKIGLCALLLLSAAGALAAKTIYLQAGIWNTGGAWFLIHYWGGVTGWATMENVTCDIYKANIPDNATQLKFLRKAPGASASGWDGNYNGHQMPSTDYWYYIRDGKLKGGSRSGHFILKR